MNQGPQQTALPQKPEQKFLELRATDRLLAMVMTLAAELHVTRDRLACLEAVLEGQGALRPGALDAFRPTPAQAARLDEDRRAFVAELIQSTLGVEVSLGAPEDGVDKFNRDA